MAKIENTATTAGIANINNTAHSVSAKKSAMLRWDPTIYRQPR